MFYALAAHALPAVDDFFGDGGALDDEDAAVVLVGLLVVDAAGEDLYQLVAAEAKVLGEHLMDGFATAFG